MTQVNLLPSDVKETQKGRRLTGATIFGVGGVVMLLLLVFMAYPFFLGIYLAMTDSTIGRTGSFVGLRNFANLLGDSIFRQTYEGSGSEVGPLILGGIRVPLDKVALGFELRHQSAEGKLPTDQGFATSTPNAVPTIDLGGFSYLFSVNFRF